MQTNRLKNIAVLGFFLLGQIISINAQKLTKIGEGVVIANKVVLRTTPSGTAKTVAVLSKGTRLILYKTDGNWVKVSAPEISFGEKIERKGFLQRNLIRSQIGWSDITDPSTDFVVSLPDAFIKSFSLNEPDFSSQIKFGEESYFIFYGLKALNVIRPLLLWSQNYQVTENVIEINGFKGKIFGFVDRHGYSNNFITIQTDTNNYIFHSRTLNPKAKGISKFFGSISFKNDIKTTEFLDRKEFAKTVSEYKFLKYDFELYEPQGQGVGSVRIGNSTLEVVFAPKVKMYSTLGAYYGIEYGKVSLLIEFLPDWEIGSIEPVEEMPFGLTEYAIQLARRIKYRPEYIEGKRVSVKKVLEFKFWLY